MSCMSGTEKKGAFRPAASGYAGSRQRNGDRYCWADIGGGRFAIALSDGMGKGEAAARESWLAVTSIIKLLQAGIDPEQALKMLNLMLMINSGEEIYSTMDLAVIDKESCCLKLYKIGAAPTAVKRKDGRIEILTAPAMPMGVMEYTSIPCVTTGIDAGDQVIMMTDGVVDSVREDLDMNWLRLLLKQIRSADPQTVSDLVLREAALNYRGREKDDMTVVAVTAGVRQACRCHEIGV